MRRPLPLLLAAVLLGACATRSPEPGPSLTPPRPVPPVAPSPAAALPPASHGALSHGGPSPVALLPDPSSAIGDSRTVAEGCLLAAGEAEAARFPPPPVMRTGGLPAARVSPVAGGVVVEHPLTHACCLTARTTTRIEGRVAVVTEALGGNPCRCRCGSTLRTALRLPPGEWTVALDLEASGATQRILQQPVRVP